MTVRDWVSARVRSAPPSLVAEMLAALRSRAGAESSSTSEACLQTAAARLQRLLAEERFGREHALDLLVIDALATLACEHAAEWARSAADLDAWAGSAVQMFGRISAHV